jgi:hypothetical protein
LIKKDKEGRPIVTTTEARQGLNTGLIWVLIGSLSLAAIAAVVFLFWN